jgi:hypothetical protein
MYEQDEYMKEIYSKFFRKHGCGLRVAKDEYQFFKLARGSEYQLIYFDMDKVNEEMQIIGKIIKLKEAI